MKEVVVVNAVRTAIGAFGGALKDQPVVKLGSLTIREALQRAGLRPKPRKEILGYGPDSLKGITTGGLEGSYYRWDSSLCEVQVDEIIMGCVLQGG